MANYLPAAGVGSSVIIGSGALCADFWDWHGTVNVIPAPSFCGGSYQEFAVGKKTGIMTISGTWDLNVNPFALGIKLGSRQTVTLKIRDNIIASSSYCICSDWDVADDADGLCKYTVVFVGDFIFNDFSNTAA